MDDVVLQTVLACGRQKAANTTISCTIKLTNEEAKVLRQAIAEGKKIKIIIKD